jgi:hypothetical protein
MMPPVETIPYGYCHCNCGQKTQISKYTQRKKGWIKGEPRRFVNGHGCKKERIDLSDAVPFKIDGVYCRLIALTQNQYTIVDAEDYDGLMQFNWYAGWARSSFYALRTCPVTGKTVRMHQDILGLWADHANRVTLDNRRKNLREADHCQSAANRGTPSHNTTGYRGVMVDNYKKKRYIAQLQFEGKIYHLGTFPRSPAGAVLAAKAYDRAALEFWGAFAVLNFPEERAKSLTSGLPHVSNTPDI